MPNKIRGFLPYALLLLAFAHPAMAEGYDDARAGVAELGNGNNAEAIRLLTRALDSGKIIDGDLAAVHFDRGLAWANSGEYDKAIADYNDAIRLNPHLVDAYHSRGVAWVKKGENDNAIPDFDLAIRFDAQNAENFDGRGVAWFNKGAYDKAIDDFDRAISLNRHDTVGLFHRGLAEFNQGKFGIAATDFAQKLQLSQDGASMILLYLSRARSGVADAEARQALDSGSPDQGKWDHGKWNRNEWPAPAIALFLGKGSPDAVIGKATDADPRIQAVRICEAYFYSGQWNLLAGDKNKSRDYFNQAVRGCPASSWPAVAAAAEVARM